MATNATVSVFISEADKTQQGSIRTRSATIQDHGVLSLTPDMTDSATARQDEIEDELNLQQQQLTLQLGENTPHTQVESTLADLVSGVGAQSIESQQLPLIEPSTSSPEAQSSSATNAPWAWHFAIAGYNASQDGESIVTQQSPYVGFVHTVEDAYDVMRSYEVHTTSKFVQVRTVQDFGKDLECLKYKHRVRFEERKKDDSCAGNRLPLQDTPFLLLGTKWFECQHGRDYHVNFKRKRNEAIETGSIIVKRRNKAATSKKVGCLAKVWMKDVLVFPTKKLRQDVKSGKKMLSKEIRTGAVKGERRIYVFLPDPSQHTNHAVGEASGVSQRVDPQVIDNIHWLVSQGIQSTKDVQLHLERYVKDDLFKYQTAPSLSNRRFFPTKKDIRNHMIAARKGRLPPKDRAEIAKQSSSAASMCVSNKLAFPKTNQTTKCRSLTKQIMSLSKRIKNPNVMSGAIKKMEDLVAFLRAGAQKEQRIQRIEKRAQEPSVLKSVSLERPPLKKRSQRVKKTCEGINQKVSSGMVDEGRQEEMEVSGNERTLEAIQGTAQQNKDPQLVQVNFEGQAQQVATLPHQIDLGVKGQHIMLQPQTAGQLVTISLPLQGTTQIPLAPLTHHTNTSQVVTSAAHNTISSADLHKLLQNQHVAVLPQHQYQGLAVQESGVMVQDDPRYINYVPNRANDTDTSDSSAARTLVQLDTFRPTELPPATTFLTSPIQLPSVTSSNAMFTSTQSVQYTTASSSL